MNSNDLSQISKLLDEKLTATEKRLKSDIDNTKSGIISEFVTFMQDHLIPLFDEKADRSNIERVERRADLLSDEIGKHNVRLKNIESIPTIAHQLKIKKAE